jgi:ribulose-phosphate 3-epimerase
MTFSSATVRIAPSILASDFLHLGDAVKEAEEGGADRLHIDVMDGRFVPNLSIGQPIVECIRGATAMTLETHLMIVEPERYVPDFVETGADIVIVHQEASPHLYRTLQQIKDLGARAGVAINPATPWIAVQEVLALTDLVLVMTVNPGFGGQAFIDMTPKIRTIRRYLDEHNLTTEVEVDGGITTETVPAVVEAGARVLVAGTSVYRSPIGVSAAVRELRQAADGALE